MGKYDGNNQYGNAGDVCVYTKSNSHRTNRQSIGHTETIANKKTIRIYDNNPNNTNKTVHTKPSDNLNAGKSKKNDIDNYVENIKKLSTGNKNNDKKYNNEKYDIKYTSDTDTDDENDSNDCNDKNIITSSRHQEDSDFYRLDVGHNDIDIPEKNTTKIKYSTKKSKLQIIDAIHAKKKTTGIRFTFSINSKTLQKPFYSIYYNVNREIYMGMIIQKNDRDTLRLSRTIEYDKLSFLNEYTIKFLVEDPNSYHYEIIQELHVDLSDFIDKKKLKKHSLLKQKLHSKTEPLKDSKEQEHNQRKKSSEHPSKPTKNNTVDQQNKKPGDVNKIKIVTLKKSKNFKC